MSDREEQMRKQQEMQLHSQMQQPGMDDDESGAGEILTKLSEDMEQDLPDELVNDPILGQQVSRVISTANLSETGIASKEWLLEISLILYLCQYPKREGLKGHRRGFAYGTTAEAKSPLSAEKKAAAESFLDTVKTAYTRSEDAMVVQESARSISESVVHNDDDNSGRGGILGRLP
jgi:hypothetical protein